MAGNYVAMHTDLVSGEVTAVNTFSGKHLVEIASRGRLLPPRILKCERQCDQEGGFYCLEYNH